MSNHANANMQYGNYLRRWTLNHETGEIGCFHDAIDIRALSAEDIQAIQAHNNLLVGAENALVQYNQALAIVERGEPEDQSVEGEDGEEIPSADYVMWLEANQIVSDVSPEIVALKNVRESTSSEGEDLALVIETYGQAPSINEPTAEEIARIEMPSLSPRQIRLVMLQLGLTDSDIEDQINLIPDTNLRAAALIEWRYATQYNRTHPLVVQLLEAMDFPPEQADILWMWATDI